MMLRAITESRATEFFTRFAWLPDRDILRGEVGAGDRVAAICYVDCSQSVGQNAFDIDEYQEQLLSDEFYSHNDNARWNIYLFLVCTDSLFSELAGTDLQLQVERNAKYGRKLLVPAERLADALATTVGPVGPGATLKPEPQLDTWHTALTGLGLGALMSDGPISRVVEDYTAGRVRSEPAVGATQGRESVPTPGFIDAAQVNAFRPVLNGRAFEFGMANLIYGENGAGKTSLLEALELWFCGGHRRAPNRQAQGVVGLRFRGDASTYWSQEHQPSLYRRRAMSWYGTSSSPPANPLVFEFSRFNFFDADAAVRLMLGPDVSSKYASRSPMEALSALVLGRESVRVQHRMTQAIEILEQTRRNLTAKRKAVEHECGMLESRISLHRQTGTVEEAALSDVAISLEAVGIGYSMQMGSDAVPIIQRSLDNALASLDEVEKLSGSTGILSLEDAEERLGRLEAALAGVQPRALVLAQQHAKLESMKGELARAMERQQLLTVGLRYLRQPRARWVHLLESLVLRLESKAQALEGLVAASEAPSLTRMKKSNLTMSSLLSRMASHSARMRALIARKEEQLALIGSAAAADGERQVALLTLALEEVSVHCMSTACPVCGARVSRRQLAQAIQKRLSSAKLQEADRQAAKLRRDLGAHRRQAAALDARLSALQRVQGALQLMGRRDVLSATMHEVAEWMTAAEGRMQSMAVLRERTVRLAGHLRSLGFTQDQWLMVRNAISGPDRRRGDPRFSVAEVAREFDCTDARVQEVRKAIAEMSSSMESIKILLVQELAADAELSASDSPQATIGAVERAVEKSREACRILADLYSKFGVPVRGGLPDFRIRLTAGTRHIAEYYRHLDALADLRKSSSMDERLLAEHQRELETLGRTIERVTSARTALSSLTRGDAGRDAAIEAFLQVNREGMARLLDALCSPREFDEVVLSETGVALHRRPEGPTSSLREVSAGQRAALALAVFLCMNKSLGPAAPPCVLLDEPIAHVDELNTLSLLDYLRALVRSGTRQVFFSTANAKVASLCRRKFDFLGSDFHEVVLRR